MVIEGVSRELVCSGSETGWLLSVSLLAPKVLTVETGAPGWTGCKRQPLGVGGPESVPTKLPRLF